MHEENIFQGEEQVTVEFKNMNSGVVYELRNLRPEAALSEDQTIADLREAYIIACSPVSGNKVLLGFLKDLREISSEFIDPSLRRV